MANYTNTQILKAIAKANGDWGATEMREGQNSTLQLYLANESNVFRNANALKASDKQPTEAIVLQRNYRASGTAKVAAHGAAGFEDSFVKPITYVRRTQTWKVSYKIAENNQFGYDEQMRHGMQNAVQNLRQDVNTYLIAQMAAKKSQVGLDSVIDFDAVTNYAFQNPLSEKDYAMQNFKAALLKNKYRGPYQFICDQTMYRDLTRAENQGGGNSTNLGFQFGNVTILQEEELATPGAYGSYGYGMAAGQAGMTTWNEPINRRGEGEVGDNQGFFTTLVDPVLSGVTYDLHVKRGIADTSGTNGHEQDVVDEYEATIIFAEDHGYTSVTDESPIFALGQLSS